MNNLLVNKSVPIRFEAIDSVDSRFMKVKVVLMHTGKNLNGSSFSKDVVEKALPSLANCPIVAYIEDNEEGEKDFSDHRFAVVIENGDIKFKYKGSAYGVIPEDNNARWETIDGKEYLVCDALVWTKFDDPIEILNRDGKKWQSMELDPESYSGEFDSEGVFHFSNFKFSGACMLGADVQPAMTGANVEVQFSQNVSSIIFNEIKSKISEYYSLTRDNNFTQEGGQKVNKTEILSKYGISEEKLSEYSIDLEAITAEELEARLVEITNNSTENSQEEGADSDVVNTEENFSNENPESEPANEPVDDPSTDFATTARQFMDHLRNKVYEEGGYDVVKYEDWSYNEYYYYYIDHTDSMVVTESRHDNWALVGFGYTVNGDVATIDWGNKVFLKVQYAPLESAEAATSFGVNKLANSADIAKYEVTKEFASKIAEYESMSDEVSSLREFKANKLREERNEKLDELFSSFNLPEEDLAEIKKIAYDGDTSVEEIKTLIYAEIGKKMAGTFSKNPTNDNRPLVRFNVDDDDQVPKGSSKPYLDIIEKHVKK